MARLLAGPGDLRFSVEWRESTAFGGLKGFTSFCLVSLGMLKNFPEPQFFHLFCGDTNTYPMELGTQRCHRWQSHPTLYTLQASGSMVHNECTYGLYLPLPRRTWEHGPLFLPFIRPIPWDGQEALIISCITGRRQIFCNKCWCVLPLFQFWKAASHMLKGLGTGWKETKQESR